VRATRRRVGYGVCLAVLTVVFVTVLLSRTEGQSPVVGEAIAATQAPSRAFARGDANGLCRGLTARAAGEVGHAFSGSSCISRMKKAFGLALRRVSVGTLSDVDVVSTQRANSATVSFDVAHQRTKFVVRLERQRGLLRVATVPTLTTIACVTSKMPCSLGSRVLVFFVGSPIAATA